MTRLILILLSCVLGLFAPMGDVRADELKDKAQELLSDGNALAAEGDFGLALVKFRTAYELYPSPKLLLNIGTSLRQIGRNAEAAETYEAYLAHAEADPTRADELRDILDDLDALVGKLVITVKEPGARVSLDGKILRDLDEREAIRVDPGEHTLIAEKPGRRPSIRHVTVKAKNTVKVELSVEAEPADEADGPDPRAVIGYTLVGLGGVAIVVGAVVGGIALGTKSDAEAKCSDAGEFAGYCSAEGSDLMKSARTEGVAATATFIAGFAVAVGGFALVFSALGDDDTVEVGVGPGSLLVRGRW